MGAVAPVMQGRSRWKKAQIIQNQTPSFSAHDLQLKTYPGISGSDISIIANPGRSINFIMQ